MKTFVNFGGGGARGIIGCGAAKAIAERESFDAIIGSSVGSLNGAMMFTGRVKELEEIWLNIRTRDVCHFAPWKMTESCLYDVSPLRSLLTKYVDIQRVKTVIDKKFYIGMSSVQDWGQTYVDASTIATEADFINALMASSAAPIAFPPVLVNGKHYYDAGMTSNYSVSEAVHLGADRIICVAISIPEQTNVRSLIDAFEIICAMPEYSQLQSEVNYVNKLNSIPGFKKIEVVVIRPPAPTGIQLLDFDLKGRDRKALIKMGYDLTVEALKGLNK